MLLASAPAEDGRYAALSPARPGAVRFERMIRDLWGLIAEEAVDLRPWLDHGRWQLARAAVGAARAAMPGAEPPQPEFLPVEGEGIHQIPVGPSMPASSSPAISASTCRARWWCGWRSGWATCTRARCR